MRRIKPLPEAVWSSVRSRINLYDLTRVVEELVFNSLDAGATKQHQNIDNLVDLDASDGSFGFRGEALCSIFYVSVLQIITKGHRMPQGYRKVMKGFKCLYLGINDDMHDAGTIDIVRDLFTIIQFIESICTPGT